ncbi:nucleotidyltransferase domain-containing protein [Candidatus Leptofilum sp.]|uniref:nucleotidyltransferase domain-containing protein n=1 Tax=Candidatus Leptofilum sp. TaxID=3241576 RepID=UPI003B59F1E6
MNLTTSDYERAFEQFVETIHDLGENGRSVLLYGSMARNEIIPGHSDLDFWVILAKDVFEDKKQFRQAFEVMVKAGQELAASGLPVIHAFCFYGEDELAWLPKALVPNLQSARSSKIVFGEDVRPQMNSTAASHHLYHSSYFFVMRRQVFLPLTPLLKKETLTQKEAKMILGSLKYVKYIPEAACAALDLWPGEIDAVPQLGEALNLDMSIVDHIAALRTQENPLSDLAQIQNSLRDALYFVEEIHNAILVTKK